MIDCFIDFAAICPDCLHHLKYPKTFKFDLILADKNYGELEFLVEAGILISQLKGSKEALEKLDQMAKKLDGENMIFLPEPKIDLPFVYPLEDIMSVGEVLGREKSFKINGNYKEMKELICCVYSPVEPKKLYLQTNGALELDY